VQLVRRDVQPLGRVVEHRLLGLLAVVLADRRDRRAGSACHERAAQRDHCDPSYTHLTSSFVWGHEDPSRT
jgi:hypothetical protein